MSTRSKVLLELLHDFFKNMTDRLKFNGFTDKRIKSIFSILEFNSLKNTDITYDYDVSVSIDGDYTRKLLIRYNFNEIISYLSDEFDKYFSNTKRSLNIKFNFKLLNQNLTLNKNI